MTVLCYYNPKDREFQTQLVSNNKRFSPKFHAKYQLNAQLGSKGFIIDDSFYEKLDNFMKGLRLTAVNNPGWVYEVRAVYTCDNICRLSTVEWKPKNISAV